MKELHSISVGALRTIANKELANLAEPLAIVDAEAKPLAVLVPWHHFVNTKVALSTMREVLTNLILEMDSPDTKIKALGETA